jgi:hypothetical protein
MPRPSPEFTRSAQLVELSNAGYFTLPAEVTDAHTVVTRLAEERASARRDLAAPALALLHDATFEAAHGRGSWPTGEDVVAAQAAQQAADLRVGALDAALEAARDEFVTVVRDLADAIVVDHLRPRFDKVVAETRPAAAAVAEFGGDLAALVAAPKPARDAWLGLDALVGAYDTLRRARGIVYAGRTPKLDDRNIFAELANLPDIWPSWRAQVDPPWPAAPKDRLCWLVSGPAKPWLPTLDEQDERFEERFAGELENMRRSRLIAAGGVHAGL